MNYTEIITNAIDYIENNLCSRELSLEAICKNINLSSSNLSRGFYILTNYTISEYIRNRRLSLSKELLKSKDKSILDVALDIGYDSPEAFTKAFKRYYGVTPKESSSLNLKDFQRLQVRVTILQETPLTPTFKEMGEIILNGDTNFVYDYNAEALWESLESDGTLDELYDLNDFKNLAGVYYNNKYTIKSICSTKTTESIILPPCKWAIFKCEGTYPNSIDETFDKIYSSFLPSFKDELLDLPQLEVYYDIDEDYYCEIWIPFKESL